MPQTSDRANLERLALKVVEEWDRWVDEEPNAWRDSGVADAIDELADAVRD